MFTLGWINYLTHSTLQLKREYLIAGKQMVLPFWVCLTRTTTKKLLACSHVPIGCDLVRFHQPGKLGYDDWSVTEFFQAKNKTNTHFLFFVPVYLHPCTMKGQKNSHPASLSCLWYQIIYNWADYHYYFNLSSFVFVANILILFFLFISNSVCNIRNQQSLSTRKWAKVSKYAKCSSRFLRVILIYSLKTNISKQNSFRIC